MQAKKLRMYGIPIVYGLVAGIAFVLVRALLQRFREGFAVPVAPSKEGDKEVVTPAGNVILY